MRHLIHDLNNHIAAVLSFSEIVLDELPANDTRRTRIEAIRTVGERAVVRSRSEVMQEIAVHVAQLRGLAFSALDDASDRTSPFYADLLEIATAAEQAFALFSDGGVRDAA